MINYKYYIKHLILWTLLFFAGQWQLNAQCKVKIVVPQTHICLGDTIPMYALGGCKSVLAEHFNYNTIGNQLSNNYPSFFTQLCGTKTYGGDYLWFGTQGSAPYSLTTSSLNLTISGGFSIEFDMKYGEEGAGGICEGPSQLSEAVHLQYSINGGTSWVDIQVWDPNGGHDASLIQWNTYSVAIPINALTNNTLFRWIQNSGAAINTANWGIDNIDITGPGVSAYWWSDGHSTRHHPDINPTSTITYSVTASCGGISCTDTITIYPVPRPSATFTYTGSQCKYQIMNFNYTGNAPASASYNWQFPGATNITGSGQGPLSAQWNKTGSYYPSLIVTQDGCSSFLFKKEVKINPLISFYMDQSFGCEPLTVKYVGNAYPKNSTYYWDFGDGGISTDSAPSYTYQKAGIFTLSIIITSPTGCTDTMSFKDFIDCYPSPNVDFLFAPPIVPFSNPLAEFTNKTQGGNSYWWDFGDNGTSNAQDPTHTYSALGEYLVMLKANSSNGCTDSITKLLKVVEDRFKTPNIITPNGDGFNDFFIVENLEYLLNCRLEVYNRWGQLVYSNDNYDNLWNAEDLADGVYFYQVDYTSFFGEDEILGTLTIIRE